MALESKIDRGRSGHRPPEMNRIWGYRLVSIARSCKKSEGGAALVLTIGATEGGRAPFSIF